MLQREVPALWRGRRVAAWVPALLAHRDLTLAEGTIRRAELATASVRRADAALPERWEPLADLLRRGEGLASSAIEDVRAPLAEVVRAELGPAGQGVAAQDPTARIVANLDAVRAAVAAGSGPLTAETLHGWHRVLMRGAEQLDARHLGTARDVQGWVGGTSPLDAALVTPPPEHLAALLGDLMAYVNRDDVDPVVQAAVAHAQFEVVHPYADGNGRIGRLLIGWVLARRLGLRSPPAAASGSRGIPAATSQVSRSSASDRRIPGSDGWPTW